MYCLLFNILINNIPLEIKRRETQYADESYMHGIRNLLVSERVFTEGMNSRQEALKCYSGKSGTLPRLNPLMMSKRKGRQHTF